MTARVAELVRYPVKGCMGESLDRVTVHLTGPRDDRMFMLAGEDGKWITQRHNAIMATIRPRLRDGSTRLELRAPDVEKLTIDVAFDGPRIEVAIGSWAGKGVDQGDMAAEWFGQVLGQRARLARVPPDHSRVIIGEAGGTAGFADGSAMHVTGVSSLADLNRRIIAAGRQPVPMNRFRPTIVVEGWEPYEEDSVRRFTAGGVELGYERIAVRCAVPTIDQSSGTKAGHEPTKTLASYRRDPGGGVTFGTRIAVITPGEVAVGDPVVITAAQPS